MPPSGMPGGIFVGLFTTNWANSPGDRGLCPRCTNTAAFLRPTCPRRPQYLNRGRPSSLFPVRLNIQAPPEVVVEYRKKPQKTDASPLFPPSNQEPSESPSLNINMRYNPRPRDSFFLLPRA